MYETGPPLQSLAGSQLTETLQELFGWVADALPLTRGVT
jgi:hypothetical protein